MQRPDQARELRRHLQYTYQDPGASLDPRWKIGKSLDEPLQIHTDLDRAARAERVREILKGFLQKGVEAGRLEIDDLETVFAEYGANVVGTFEADVVANGETISFTNGGFNMPAP